MSHPPIPPNCTLKSYKWTSVPGRVTALLPFDGGHPHIDSVDGPACRLVIAAVARCAWLDEADRIRANIIASVSLPEEVVDEMLACNPEAFPCAADEIRKARANAEAWRVWGVAKATQ